ncbi:MAG TPA: Xaa-Pro peptidase family protein [Bryobacteraceae bacterium]|jgi:Xaa-Pro aminopeptidase|nr:Xaa-Pro peptidase family protein [Bryobacteraceae bacterium]
MNTMSGEFEQRRQRLRQFFKELRVDAILVTALPNVRYLSGFTGSNAMLLVTADRELLFTDPRYQAQAPRESECEVKVAKGALPKQVLKWVKRLLIRKLGFEEGRIGFAQYQRIKEDSTGVRLMPVANVPEKLRMVKSPVEIAAIRASVDLNSQAFEEGFRHFRPSMSEVDLAAEIDYRMRLLGADSNAFSTIVASGERTALPHAHPSVQAIERNELLLIDMGATVSGYASDMTRTRAVGTVSAKARRMYRAVLESQLAAIEAVRPGVSCSRVDEAAREVLRGYQLDKAFIHSTGHGLGLEIHEDPRVGRKEKTKLTEGMTITIEPGAYIEGLGGIRIEDTVVVTEHGCAVLTPTPKELVVL